MILRTKTDQNSIDVYFFFADCGPLSDPIKGGVSYPTGLTTYQEVAVFSCDAGYTLVGNENRTCGANGKWDGSSRTCQIKGKYL